MDPRRERRVAPKTGQPAVSANQGILRDLLCIGPVAEQSDRDREDSVTVAHDNFVKRLLVTGVEALDKQGIEGGLGHRIEGSGN